jgi:hypothetical protein
MNGVVEVTNPFMMPQRSREEAQSCDGAAGHRPVDGDARRSVEEWGEMPRPLAAERELVLAHREAV